MLLLTILKLAYVRKWKTEWCKVLEKLSENLNRIVEVTPRQGSIQMWISSEALRRSQLQLCKKKWENGIFCILNAVFFNVIRKQIFHWGIGKGESSLAIRSFLHSNPRNKFLSLFGPKADRKWFECKQSIWIFQDVNVISWRNTTI